MNRLRITHTTGFRYPTDVVASYNEARMLPQSSDGQLVLQSKLDISPVSSRNTYVDYWGTRVTSFEILSGHRELSLSATSLVEVRPKAHATHEISWQELARVTDRSIESVEHLRQTGRTAPPDEVVALAREIADGAANPCDAGLAICQAIGAEVQYVPGSTGVATTAKEAWLGRRGVCQDITHIALGALRSVGIPARYVSGYLHPVPDAKVGETVQGESHAWVEFFCGEWRGYDPTNTIDIGDRHVTVGRGRDYGDIAPLRGVYAGPNSSELFVTVEITREA